MQLLPIYLYPNNIDVILDLDPTIRGVNQIMYQRDLKIQKGVKNTVRVQFKNSDQKRINVSGNYVFNMFDATNRRLLLTKPLKVLDNGTTLSLRGIAELTLLPTDTINLENSDYTYSVTYIDPSDNNQVAAYSNTYYGINGTIHLASDIYPPLQPSQEVSAFQSRFNNVSNLYDFFSGNLYAHPEYKNGIALQTLAIYMSKFRGTVTIQGTLSNQPDSVVAYSTITTLNYSNYSGIDYLNFNGIYTYIRVIYTPSIKPGDSTNDNPSYYGSLDKVLYRS
jgi:hypothetical protein